MIKERKRAIKLPGLSQQETNDLIKTPGQLLFLGYRGSITHGTYEPNKRSNSIDDKDIIGVWAGGADYYFGFRRKDTFERKYNEWDGVFYEFKKFVWLLLKQNPNVLSCLWLDEKHVICSSDAWQELVYHKDLFVSTQAYHSFTGYAYSQLKRMTHLACEGYMGAKRKALVQQHGYDTKNAAHLIRLLRMSVEWLTEGRLIVERPDAPNLLQIKHGEWPLEKVKLEADKLFALARDAYVHSDLRRHPCMENVERLQVKILWQLLNEEDQTV